MLDIGMIESDGSNWVSEQVSQLWDCKQQNNTTQNK